MSYINHHVHHAVIIIVSFLHQLAGGGQPPSHLLHGPDSHLLAVFLPLLLLTRVQEDDFCGNEMNERFDYQIHFQKLTESSGERYRKFFKSNNLVNAFINETAQYLSLFPPTRQYHPQHFFPFSLYTPKPSKPLLPNFVTELFHLCCPPPPITYSFLILLILVTPNENVSVLLPETMKGINAVQQCSIENQKGAICIDIVQQFPMV